MPRITWSRLAYVDMARLHAFLAPKSEIAASRAIRAIHQGVKPLAKHPEIGRMVDNVPPEIREWVIEFGQGAYIVRYEYDGKRVIILAIRHGREAGF